MNFMFCNFAGPGKKKKEVIHSWLFTSSTLHLPKDVCFICPQHTTAQANVNEKTD